MPRVLTTKGITMALPVCTHCEQYEGVLMVTTLTDGDTQVICPQDILLYALTLAATLTEGMTKEQVTAYQEQADKLIANLHAAMLPPASKTPRKRQPPPAAPVPPDGPQSDAAALVALVPPCSECGGTTATGDAAKLVCNECGAVIATASTDNLSPGGQDA